MYHPDRHDSFSPPSFPFRLRLKSFFCRLGTGLWSWIHFAGIQVLGFFPYALSVLPLAVPLVYLDLPWYGNSLILFVCAVFQRAAIIIPIVWIWSFVIFCRSPFWWFSVVYLVTLALYLILSVIPRSIAFFRNR